MQPIEIISLFILFTSWAIYLAPIRQRPKWLILLPALSILMLISQIIIEAFLWTFVPAYFLAVLVLLLSTRQLFHKSNIKTQPAKRLRRILVNTGKVFCCLALAFTIALPALFPVFNMPQPSGIYAVGTSSFEWVDKSRPETFTADPNDNRDLMVQVWYPAEKVTGVKPMTLWFDAKTVGSVFGGAISMPPFLFDHLSAVTTKSYFEAPLALHQTAYPVIIFSHGFLGTVYQNTVQMEELASHGYVVFSVDHTYESVVTIYPNGRVVPYSQENWKAHNSPETAKAFDTFNKQFAESTSNDSLEALIRPMLSLEASTVNHWTQDALFALDQITLLNSGDIASQFAGHLDLERVGMFGHSMGGAATGEACSRDMRIKAGINLDGPQYGTVIDNPIRQPFMLMSSMQTDMPSNVPNAATGKTMNDLVYDRGNNTFYHAVVQGTKHFNFCDLSMVSPLFKTVGFLGDIDGYRMEEIMNAYVLAFFDKTLKGIDSPLLDAPSSSYPEVDFTVRNA